MRCKGVHELGWFSLGWFGFGVNLILTCPHRAVGRETHCRPSTPMGQVGLRLRWTPIGSVDGEDHWNLLKLVRFGRNFFDLVGFGRIQ